MPIDFKRIAILRPILILFGKMCQVKKLQGKEQFLINYMILEKNPSLLLLYIIDLNIIYTFRA